MDFMFEAKMTNGASEVESWTDLTADALECIIKKLTIADRIRCAQVCRRWSSIVREVLPHNGLSYGLPCLVSICNDSKACTLVDIFGYQMHIKCPNLPYQSRILFSKDEWLLVLSGDDRDSIFFFNPMTNARIDLPSNGCPHHNNIFAFSSDPTSADCVVIAVGSPRPSEDDTRLQFCRHGQKEWTELWEEDSEFPFRMSYAIPFFYQGSFYFVGDDGRLATFDTKNSVWSVMENPKPIQDLDSKIKPFYTAESDGGLMMIFADKSGDTIQILKLDPLTSQWENTDTIGNTSLFVGLKSYICSKANNALEGNRIYFPRTKDGEFMFYSCEDRKLHPSGNFNGSELFQLSFWIEPVWYQYSPEELKWGN